MQEMTIEKFNGTYKYHTAEKGDIGKFFVLYSCANCTELDISFKSFNSLKDAQKDAKLDNNMGDRPVIEIVGE